MKKQILNIGKALSKAEQRTIHGGSECTRAPFPLVSHCDAYASESSCNADPVCLWGDWSWEGSCPNSCAKPGF